MREKRLQHRLKLRMNQRGVVCYGKGVFYRGQMVIIVTILGSRDMIITKLISLWETH